MVCSNLSFSRRVTGSVFTAVPRSSLNLISSPSMSTSSYENPCFGRGQSVCLSGANTWILCVTDKGLPRTQGGNCQLGLDTSHSLFCTWKNRLFGNFYLVAQITYPSFSRTSFLSVWSTTSCACAWRSLSGFAIRAGWTAVGFASPSWGSSSNPGRRCAAVITGVAWAMLLPVFIFPFP